MSEIFDFEFCDGRCVSSEESSGFSDASRPSGQPTEGSSTPSPESMEDTNTKHQLCESRRQSLLVRIKS